VREKWLYNLTDTNIDYGNKGCFFEGGTSHILAAWQPISLPALQRMYPRLKYSDKMQPSKLHCEMGRNGVAGSELINVYIPLTGDSF